MAVAAAAAAAATILFSSSDDVVVESMFDVGWGGKQERWKSFILFLFFFLEPEQQQNRQIDSRMATAGGRVCLGCVCCPPCSSMDGERALYLMVLFDMNIGESTTCFLTFHF